MHIFNVLSFFVVDRKFKNKKSTVGFVPDEILWVRTRPGSGSGSGSRV